MKIGLIGLPTSGKTTIFNALTNSEADVKRYTAEKAKPNRKVVNIIDERITRLSEIYKPKKTVYAAIELIDFLGLPQGPSEHWALSSQAIALMKNTDALALVVRNFQDNSMEEPNPLADLRRIQEELLLSDLVIFEGRLQRIGLGHKRGKNAGSLQMEEKVLQKILEQVNSGKPIRDLRLSRDEKRIICGFQFLTEKPHMIILNSDETNFEKSGPFRRN